MRFGFDVICKHAEHKHRFSYTCEPGHFRSIQINQTYAQLRESARPRHAKFPALFQLAPPLRPPARPVARVWSAPLELAPGARPRRRPLGQRQRCAHCAPANFTTNNLMVSFSGTFAGTLAGTATTPQAVTEEILLVHSVLPRRFDTCQSQSQCQRCHHSTTCHST